MQPVEMIMKKVLFTLLIALSAISCAWAGKASKVESLVKQYRGNDGFEVVSLGPVGLSLLKIVGVSSGELDAEDRAVLSAFNGIRRLTIVDFESLQADLKEQFRRKLETVLKGMELILEAKDGESSMRIYGVDDGNMIRDCILYSSEGAIICTRGRIETERLGELMEMAQ